MPYQKVLLQLDTGSNDLLVYSPTCSKDVCPGNAFDPATSSTFQDQGCASELTCQCDSNKCKYHAGYGDGAFADGYVAKEHIVMNDLRNFPVESFIGLIDEAGGNADASVPFYTNASLSGILGLAPTTAGSAFGRRSVILDLAQSHGLPLGFTICLRPHVGGALIIGEDYTDTTVAAYMWSAQTKDEMYTVKVKNVLLGDNKEHSLDLSFDHALLDSGTTNIMFPMSAQQAVKDVFRSYCPGLKGICDNTGPSIWNNWIVLDSTERNAFPDLWFEIDGAYKPLHLTPSMYLTEFNGYYVMNIDFMGSDLILGNGFMKNFRIGFDVSGKRIGFSDISTCPGDNDIEELRNDPASFRVSGSAQPQAIDFVDPRGYEYAWFCGWDASSLACTTSDPLCKTSAATKPAFEPTCPQDWNYAIGPEVEYQVRWGKALGTTTGQAGVGFDDSVVTAVPPYSTPFVFSTIKYYNAPIDPSSYVSSILVRTNVRFLSKEEGSPAFATFSYDMKLKITNFDVCEGAGCPWTNPEEWPEHFINDECKEMSNGDFRLVDENGPLCCPYYTSQNAFNQCSDLVEIVDDGDASNDLITLDGQTWKVKLVGFHANVPGHRGRGLIEAFAADFMQLTTVNVHAQLIDLCPDCPPGTQQVQADDGSCTCACTQQCDLPLSQEPDCSCIARVSHSHCSADCGEAERQALGCDATYGEVYATADQCLCRCARGCPAGFRQTDTCKCVCDCDPKATPPPNVPEQHHECNKWICNANGVGCKYVADGDDVCSRYQWPLTGKPKDRQCWKPKCVKDGATAECRGTPMNVDPESCKPPPGVSPHCYVPKCDGAGYCSLEFLSSNGGQEPGSPHPGTCPVPPGMDARCYWPFCNAEGKCDGDIFTGKPYTKEGDWKDGTMGTRPGQPPCTVQELTDAGNAKYGKFNPECFVARCDGGKCGGDAVNFGQPCNPIDGRNGGDYNEVFVGASWPGITPDCVYYVCGTNPGERGHCIQLPLPGARQTPCHNSDNDKCTHDWCDGLGMCKDHEWIQGHHAEGVCVTSTCDPATGAWTYERNGEACCENGVINFGEECEVGVNGADDKCCVDCYLQTTCNDNNVCTTETCVSGKCVATFDAGLSNKCPPLDVSIADNKCKLVACSAESGKCEEMPDPTKEGVECMTDDADDQQCNHHVCRAGHCVLEPTDIGVACSLPTTPELTCKSLRCVAVDGRGECQPVADDTKFCDDSNPCTSESCVGGECVSKGVTVVCAAPEDDCHAPGVCDPSTGQCSASVALPDGTSCAKPADAPAQDLCSEYVCSAGACVRSSTGGCLCGNGQHDAGEQCDYNFAPHKECCSNECQGCLCGNGVLDEGEQCDFAIPSQLECCSKECQGCLCGNGVLDEGEACDPVLAAEEDECCTADCKPCGTVNRASNVGAAVGATVAGLTAAFALAAFIAVRARAYTATEVGDVAPGAEAASQMVNNPVYRGDNARTNALFEPLVSN